jgi:hypothetical protein
VQTEPLKFAAGGGKLALAAIDDDQVGEANGDKSVIPSGVEGPRRGTCR